MRNKYAKVMFSKDGTGTWEGPPLAEVSRDLLWQLGIQEPKVGDVLWIGPFQVRIMELFPVHRSIFDDIVIVERRSKGIQEKAFLFWYKLAQLLKLINRRLLITAKVWNLLDTQEGMEYRWGDLRFIKALGRLFEKHHETKKSE